MKFGQTTVALIASLATAQAASIYETAAGVEIFSTLVAAVDAAGLTETLSGEGTYTVFAPSNDAFDALPEGTVAKLLEPEWIFHLQDVLKYHTLDSVVMSTDLSEGLTTPTLNLENIVVSLEPPRITTVSGGVSNILVDVPLVDIEADNGVVHGVDAVMLPTSATSSIVDIAVGNPDFSTLVAAVTAADLVDALSGEGPLTVFAPTNAAFDALPDGTLDMLLLPENKEMLHHVLLYHVVRANAHSSTLADGPVETLHSPYSVDITTEGGVMVNDANVVAADILASNGIIHVIDKVILPPDYGEAATTVAPGSTAAATTVAPPGATTEAPPTATTTEAPPSTDDSGASSVKVAGISAFATVFASMLF